MMNEESLAGNLLAFCKKEQLIEFCEDYDIPFKSVWNKARLAEVLEEELLRNPKILMKVLSVRDFKVMGQLIQTGGIQTVSALEPFMPLIMRGLVFTEIPKEKLWTVSLNKPFMEAIAPGIESIVNDPGLIYQSELDDILLGIITLYGLVTESEITRKFNSYSGEKFTKMDVLEMILTRDSLKSRFLSFERGDTLFLQAVNMNHPEQVLKEIRMRKDLEDAAFSKDEIIRSADPDYFPRTDAARSLEKELKKKGVEWPARMVRTIWFMNQNDVRIPEIMHFLMEKMEFSGTGELQRFVQLLSDFSNGVPHWILKGNSPEEVFREEKRFLRPFPPESPRHAGGKVISMAPPKTGRNDPCPCGSGKKYKHCCGRHT